MVAPILPIFLRILRADRAELAQEVA